MNSTFRRPIIMRFTTDNGLNERISDYNLIVNLIINKTSTSTLLIVPAYVV